MRTRTATAVTLLLAAGTLGTLTGTATAAPGEAGPTVTNRAWALYTGPDALVGTELRVVDVRGAGTTAELALFADGWECTVDGAAVVVAQVGQLDSARVDATFGYTCTADDGGPQGLRPGTATGTVTADVAWTATGATVMQPAYHCNVGRSLARAATVTGSVMVTGGLADVFEADPAIELAPTDSGLTHERLMCPPGWPADV
jgi:hypothetical protein